MKNVFLFAVLIIFALATQAQSKIQPDKDLNQKKYLDSLHKKYKRPAPDKIILPPQGPGFNTPISPMFNDGEIAGMNGEDTIYRMKKDNMLLLKPNRKTTGMPNAAEGKIFMVPPAKKKP